MLREFLKNKKTKLIYLTVFCALLITSCNEPLNLNEKEETDNNYTKKSYTIQKLEEGTKLDEIVFSPNKENYIIEENEIIYHDMEGHVNVYLIRASNSEEIVEHHYYDGNIKFEKNLFMKPAIWINNEEVLIHGKYIYNIITKDKRKLALPFKNYEYGNTLLSCAINKDLNTLSYLLDHGGLFHIGIYQIDSNNWSEIYTFSVNGYNSKKILFNLEWDVNDNIFFTIMEEHNPYETINSIKKYNAQTEEITDFMENAAVLTMSSDYKYLTILDNNSNTTKIINVENNNAYEVPYTVEIDWHPAISEFSYIDPNDSDYIYINTIIDNKMYEDKVFIGNIDTKEEVRNIQYVGEEVRFDIVKYTEGDIRVFDKVITYSIIEN